MERANNEMSILLHSLTERPTIQSQRVDDVLGMDAVSFEVELVETKNTATRKSQWQSIQQEERIR